MQIFFGSRDTRIDQVALKHYIVIYEYRHNDDRIFRSLCLMNGCGISQSQFVEFRYIVFYGLAIEIYRQRSLVCFIA